jgi:hypothetical protein
MPLNEQALPGTAINGDHRVFSDFFAENNIIQQVAVVHPKNLIIQYLRDLFSKDSVFTYRSDEYGFPLTVDLTGKDLETTDTTKILISDVYRYDVKFFPAIVIKHSGGSYKPNSFNQDGVFKYRKDYIEDAFGGRRPISIPTHKVYQGRWDLGFDVSIYSESYTELQEIVDIVSIALQHVLWNDLRASGLFISSLNIGAESAEQYANDYVYSQGISLKTLSEWRVEIPIENTIEKILFNIDSQLTTSPFEGNTANSTILRYDDLLNITRI